MRFRKKLFYGLALFVILIMAFLFLAYGTNSPDEDVQNEDAFNCGRGIGVTMVFCVGLPFVLSFGLLGWRNSVGIRNEERHRETMDAMRNQ